MPDYLSRLVKRTFGLTTIAKPVPTYLFSPERSLRNNHIQGLVIDNESVSVEGGIDVDSFQNTKVFKQQNNQPLLNHSLYENGVDIPDQIRDRVDQSDFTSKTKPNQNISQHIIKPIKQSDPGFPEQIETLSSDQLSEQEIQYNYSSPVEPAQDNRSFYRSDPAALEPIERKPSKEQFSHNNQDFTEQIDSIVSSVDSTAGKTLVENIPDSSRLSERSSSLEIGEPILETNKEHFEKPRNLNIGLYTHYKQLVEIGGLTKSSKSISRDDLYPQEDIYQNVLSSPIIPIRRDLKQVDTLKVNAAAEHIGSMSVERQNAAVSRFPSTSPAIKVTIGRIEVRAVKPSLEPQPQTPPPRQYPVLSLDDYLKQHNV